MPTVISSTMLRNNYNAVSEKCQESADPIFITRNGNGDLAVMGIDSYEQMKSRLEFYEFLMQGHRDTEANRMRPALDALADLRQELNL